MTGRTGGEREVWEAESGPLDTPAGAEPGDRTGAPGSRLGVLRHRDFRNVWLGAMGSSVGGWMEFVGVQWIMAQQTLAPEWVTAGRPSSTIMMGYLAAAQLGPTLLLGLLGGLMADRVNRKSLLLWTQGVMMIIAVGLAAAAFGGWATPTVLLAFAAVHGVALAFNTPAWQVLTPRLVPRAELTRAITLNGVQFNLARVVGPALGGAILSSSESHGAAILFVVNALSFLGVMVAISSTPDAPPPERSDGQGGPWEQTKEAFAFVFHNRGPRAVFFALVLFSALAAPLMRMLPLFVTEVFHAQEKTYGLLLAVMGVGAVLGGLSLRLVPRWYPKHHLIPLSVMLGGVSITLFTLTTSLTAAMAAIFLAGAFWLWSFNSAMAAMQLLVDDRMRGRVMAVCNTAVFGAMPLGSLSAGVIGEVVGGHSARGDLTDVGVRTGVGLLSGALAVAGLVMLVWRTPEVDGYTAGDPATVRRPGLLNGITGRLHRPRS